MAAQRANSSRGTRQPAASARRQRYWSAAVTKHSNALDLEAGVFRRAPREIARSLKRSAERSTRRLSSPFRSAMSMLTFYENRAGRALPPARRRAIRLAKDELRRLFGRPTKRSRRPPRPSR
jgi:hypothetical protein